MKINNFLILFFSITILSSCGSKKKISSAERPSRDRGSNENAPAEIEDKVRNKIPTGSYADIVQNYIANYGDIAKAEMRIYKIPASITLAQGILESGAGRGELTRRANNHFGIKCHDWKGEMVYHDDDRNQECFRKYNDPELSFRDHSLFLAERGRYAALFKLDPDDYKAWAKGLRAAGYATDRHYPNKLIDLIERFDLDELDQEVLGNTSGKRRSRNIEKEAQAEVVSGYHVVEKGDTLYSIAKRYGTTVESIQRKNNLNGNTLSIGQKIIVE